MRVLCVCVCVYACVVCVCVYSVYMCACVTYGEIIELRIHNKLSTAIYYFLLHPCESGAGQLLVQKSGELLLHCGVCVSVVHDISLFSDLASSVLHLHEFSIAHYSDSLTTLCNSISGKEH